MHHIRWNMNKSHKISFVLYRCGFALCYSAIKSAISPINFLLLLSNRYRSPICIVTFSCLFDYEMHREFAIAKWQMNQIFLRIANCCQNIQFISGLNNWINWFEFVGSRLLCDDYAYSAHLNVCKYSFFFRCCYWICTDAPISKCCLPHNWVWKCWSFILIQQDWRELFDDLVDCCHSSSRSQSRCPCFGSNNQLKETSSRWLAKIYKHHFSVCSADLIDQVVNIIISSPNIVYWLHLPTQMHHHSSEVDRWIFKHQNDISNHNHYVWNIF